MRRDLEDLVPYCPKCGYNLTGLKEYRCPECGTEFDPIELLRRQVLGPHPSIARLVVPNLIVAPIFVSGAMVWVGISFVSNIAGFAVAALLFAAYLVRNARKVQNSIAQTRHESQRGRNTPGDFLSRGGIITLLLIQLLPLVILWGGLIWFLIRNPPRFFGL